MENIRTYSRKRYNVTINTWYYNPISVARAFNIPHEECFPFEKAHGLLNIVAEDSENYSYS